MFSVTADAPVLLEIHEEHERLEILIAELKWVLLKPSDTHLSIMKELMDELSDLLQEHFAHEEEGGYFDELVEMQPTVSTRVERLRQEHRQMLAAVANMIRQLRHADSTPLWFAVIGVEFTDFVQRCEAHQHEENRLVLDGYLRDVGEGD
ncbi:MAG: hemerythrin domain-containing protein [Planctomycetaceae bacterium]